MISEREEGKEREGNIDRLPPVGALTGDEACSFLVHRKTLHEEEIAILPFPFTPGCSYLVPEITLAETKFLSQSVGGWETDRSGSVCWMVEQVRSRVF